MLIAAEGCVLRSGGVSRSVLEVLLKENLHEHDVAPLAVEAGVLLVDADLAEAEGAEQFAARGFSTKTLERSFQKPRLPAVSIKASMASLPAPRPLIAGSV